MILQNIDENEHIIIIIIAKKYLYYILLIVFAEFFAEFQDSVMNKKFKRITFIWNLHLHFYPKRLAMHYRLCIFCQYQEKFKLFHNIINIFVTFYWFNALSVLA